MSRIIQNIQDRMLKQNRNWLAVICGPTGSGKSFAAISIAKAIDPTFRVKDRVVFTPQQFMAALNSGTLDKGNALVFDEAGVGMPSREWYSISNRLLNYVMQTFRTDNLAVIFTVPSFDFVDVNLRKLFHVYMETVGINYSKRRCKIRYKEIQYNPQEGKLYFKYPRVPNGNGHDVITHTYARKPNIKEVREYDRLREEYSKQLKDSTQDRLDPDYEAPKKETKTDIIMREWRAGKTAREIALEQRISYDYVRRTIPVGVGVRP